MAKDRNNQPSLGGDAGAYYVQLFHSIGPISNGSLTHQQIGKFINSNETRFTTDARNELRCLSKDAPEQRIFMDQFLIICLGRRPQGVGQRFVYKWAKAAADIFLAESRRSSHLRLFLADFPYSLISPLSVLLLTVTQLVSCIQMRRFLAAHPTWTIFGYLRYHSNLGYLTEGYHYAVWFFTAPFIEDNVYRLVLSLLVNVFYVLPWSLTLTCWRPMAVVATASLAACVVASCIRTQYYCGSAVTIEAFLWAHFVLMLRNKDEVHSASIKLLVAPLGTALNLLATLSGGVYEDFESLGRLLVFHATGWFTGVTVAFQILKQHRSQGLAAQFYAGFYVLCIALWCVGYFVNRLTSVFGDLPVEVTRTDYWASDLAASP